MALSNIFREPRREITESMIGIAIVGGVFIAPGVWFALSLGPGFADNSCGVTCSIILTGLLLWPLAFGGVCVVAMGLIFVAMGLIFGTHALGESVCDALQERGIHLRPRVRR